MKVIITSLFILFGLLANASEFSNFEQNLEKIKESTDMSVNEKHFALYQHTLNLGVYGLHYLSSRNNGNGIFLELMKESWKEYITTSNDFVKDITDYKKSDNKSVSALNSLFLIERTQSLYNTYMDNKGTRLILKDQSLVLENRIEHFLKRSLNKDIRKLIPYLIREVKSGKPQGRENSVIFSKYLKHEDLREFANLDAHPSDFFTKLFSVATNSLSYSFGAIAGPIEWGDGGQLRNDAEAQERIYNDLRPLDIIFEKKTYKLTDYTIPGYWGHNAVWLGTKDQLIELGIWDAKELDPFRDRIEAGESIFEMRKWGITFANFNKWIDMDAYAHMRVKGILKKSKKDLLKVYRIFGEQINKNYDFGFNADTSFKITCSEVIYLAYGDYNWPTKNIFGRNTISPNDMAEAIYYKNSPFEFVSFVLGDEKKGATFHTKEYFANLMGFNAKDDGTFKKRYNECRLKYKRHNRREIRIVNTCKKKEKYLTL
jgi:hypothetical protein